MYIFSGAVREICVELNTDICNFEVRHPRCIGSITKDSCVLHIQLNTTIFQPVVLLGEI